MIKINIPNNNIPEREYTINILLNEFLGLNYSLEIGSDNYEILLPNKQRLIIKDTFFNKYPKDLEYLKLENIPKSIKELDIFAICFFMLTRWEEYVNRNRDTHNRFPATESLAYREGFLDRPIVNEIVEDLKSKLLELDSSLVFKKREFELVLTHDVDHLYLWKSYKQFLRMVAGDMLRRKNIVLAWSHIKTFSLLQLKRIKEPYDTFDWLMDISEELGVQSRFYLMSGGVTLYDNNYKMDDPNLFKLIEKIKKRGHLIGIHPSYNAYNNSRQFKQEKELLEKITNQKIVEGREHYLRFEVPTTWQIWEEHGMQIDSTCGYADKDGFRCGTGDEFPVFNILTRKKLTLKERPLIVMDCTLFDYNRYNYTQAGEKIKALSRGRYSFTLLWHNSYINHIAFYKKYILNIFKVT